jgi:hypothetical protein
MGELVLDRDEFTFVKLIWRGGQADAELWTRDGVNVVAKVFRDPGQIDSEGFLKEARILVKLRHPALLQGLGVSLPKKAQEPAMLWVQ